MLTRLVERVCTHFSTAVTPYPTESGRTAVGMTLSAASRMSGARTSGYSVSRNHAGGAELRILWTSEEAILVCAGEVEVPGGTEIGKDLPCRERNPWSAWGCPGYSVSREDML